MYHLFNKSILFFATFSILNTSIYSQTTQIKVGGVLKNDGDTINICFGESLLFNSDTNGFFSPSYDWTFSNGSPNSSVFNQETVNYNTSGIQLVSLVVSDTVNSDSAWVYIYVLDSIIPSSINSAQVICYNTAPLDLTRTDAVGADSTFTYDWEWSANGTSGWTSTGQSGLTYSPGLLTAQRWFRVKVLNSLCSVTKYSNIIDVFVREDISAGNITPAFIQICYNTSTPLTLNNTVGGDSNYVYVWEESLAGANSWSNATGATNSTSYTTELLLGSHDYRVRVNSGCGIEDTTAIAEVNVADQFIGGTVIGIDTICYNTIPTELTATGFAGGRTPYMYQWQRKPFSGLIWNNVGNNNYIYQETIPLFENTMYRMLTTSNDGCGVVNTDTLVMVINPLPNNALIIGDQQVCANQKDVAYAIDSVYFGYAYNWTLAKGTVVGSQTLSTVIINWDNSPLDSDTLFLEQTITSTGCSITEGIEVQIEGSVAPNKTSIIHKPNSNILVCNDSTQNIQYQWGYDIRTNGNTEIIIGADLRYVQLPHAIDTMLYKYWVQTFYTYSSTISCETKSYFNPLPIIASTNELSINNTFIVYPNPSMRDLNIAGVDLEKSIINIFDLKGSIVRYSINRAGNSIRFGDDIPNGIYFISIINNATVFTRKIMLNR
ncbi:MAG: hypothetical protein COA49_03355 [Bacteroidetes bacterium]|nr:MAG: hypothetical protein COA49_03355 [Bacteroidota bacterium]